MTATRHPVTKMLTIYLGFLGCLILFAPMCSCTTQDKFNRTADKHKDWLAEKCESTFPIDTTSIETNTDTTEADNIDYSKTIDSLRSIAENALNQVKVDTIYSEKDCNELLQKQARTINNLSKAISTLRANYKPCKPSYITRTITITKESTAKLYKAQKEVEDLKEELNGEETKTKWLFGLLLISVALIFILKK